MSKKILIGHLNNAVILKKITTVVSTTGAEKETEVEFINPLWAALDDISGNESEDGKTFYLNVRIFLRAKFLFNTAYKRVFSLNIIVRLITDFYFCYCYQQ